MRRFLRSVLCAGFGLAIGPAWGATDADLARRIQDKLSGSPLLMARRIRVEVREGTAVLRGEVMGLFEAQEAGELAERVTGIRELDLRLMVITPTVTDAVLASRVKRSFDLIPRLQAARLAIQAQDGVVALSGILADGRLRFDAREAAARIEGVREVKDALTTPDQEDGVIQRGLLALLGPRALERVRGEYAPSVMEGIVTLEGKAPRLWEKRQAEKVAWGINGVKKVINLIAVEVPPRGPKVIRPGEAPGKPVHPAD